MRCIDLCPGLYNREDLSGGEVGEGKVVGWCKRDNVAFSSNWLNPKQEAGEIWTDTA